MHHLLTETCSKIVAKYTRIADGINLFDMFDSEWQVQSFQYGIYDAVETFHCNSPMYKFMF